MGKKPPFTINKSSIKYRKFLKGGEQMINIYSQNGDTGYSIIEYILDTENDLTGLAELKAGAGSTALIISTSEVYMKNSLGEWVKL